MLHPQPGPAAGLGAVHGGGDGADGRTGQREDAGERDGGEKSGSGGDMVPSGMQSMSCPKPRAFGLLKEGRLPSQLGSLGGSQAEAIRGILSLAIVALVIFPWV